MQNFYFRLIGSQKYLRDKILVRFFFVHPMLCCYSLIIISSVVFSELVGSGLCYTCAVSKRGLGNRKVIGLVDRKG